MKLLDFTIPATPVAKGRTRSVVRRGRGGKIITTANGAPVIGNYTPETTRNFEALVKGLAAEAMGGRAPLDCPVDLVVAFYFRVPSAWPKWRKSLATDGLVHHTKKPDCSNLVKAVEDACNGIVWRDDGQVVGSTQDKAWTTGAEGIRVQVYRRAGVTCQAERADVAKALAGYSARLSTDHLPLGSRMRSRFVVSP